MPAHKSAAKRGGRGLRQRTKKFALDDVRFCRTLPHAVEGDVFRRQLLKSGTSVGANYRATCRGRSPAEKKAKLGIAIEESDESLYWLELLDTLNLGQANERRRLMKEADELTAIFVTGRAHM
jgi:four helix bundle protein